MLKAILPRLPFIKRKLDAVDMRSASVIGESFHFVQPVLANNIINKRYTFIVRWFAYH